MPETPASAGRSFAARLVGALKLDASVYEEVEHDDGALAQAAGVVGLGALAQMLVGALGAGMAGLLGGLVSAFFGWLLSAGVVWVIGVKALGHRSDYGELLRTTGFASAPKLLLVLAVIPLLGPLVWLAVTVLMVAAYVIAVRQALDVTTWRAVFVCVLAVGVSVLLGLFLGGFSALPG